MMMRQNRSLLFWIQFVLELRKVWKRERMRRKRQIRMTRNNKRRIQLKKAATEDVKDGSATKEDSVEINQEVVAAADAVVQETEVAAEEVAAKKPAAKKPAVKKVAAKKPAAKKVAVKKPAAKKVAAKKPAAKKVAAKKPAAKKAAAKKTVKATADESK